MSIRDRFRHYKRKKTKIPAELPLPLPSSEHHSSIRHINQKCERVNFPGGTVLFKKAFEDEFLERLAHACLHDFPFREDTITNVEKLGRSKLEKSWLKKLDVLKDSPLKELRWTTMGYHHNWDSRKYNDQARGEMAPICGEIGDIVKTLLDLESFNPEAAICNYYPAGLGSIGIHRDDSEYCHAPIVSLSLGSRGIFLLGRGGRDDPCFEIMLEHGDLLIMDGNDREALHAVPRVIETPIYNIKDVFIKKYLSQARINLNLRQTGESVMASNEENDLKAQVEKIADSIKEQAAQNQPNDNGDGVTQDVINQQLAAFKDRFPFQGARSVTKNKDWAFWNTQPVPKFEEKITDENMGPIEPSRDNVRQEPYTLPKGFEWDTMDINKEADLVELYTLLNENYVEDDDNMFRFDYSTEFLKWALTPPGWHTEWHCAVRVSSTKKMVGFISAIPAQINVKGTITDMVEINYLCVLKKLRSKRVAPTLIREITRRVNQKGIFQACYTAGVVIPRPVGVARYHHRNLNPKKLVAIQFTSLGKNQTMNRMIRLMKVPDQPSIPGLRPMERKDCTKAWKLLSNYLKKFNLAPVYSEDEFVHWFLPRDGVIYSYVVENADGDITDFASYYSLPSTVVNNKQYDKLNAAYCYYNVSSRLTTLMKDMLTVAKQQDFDVFNALDSMENAEFLKPLKFGEGDGSLNYYLYNWRCPELKKEELGLVLL